jgi:hypothetical protein
VDRTESVKGALRAVALAVVLVGLWGFLPDQDVYAQSECYDAVAGVGLVRSPSGTGFAAFGFLAGYRDEDSPLNGYFAAVDRRSGFSIRALTVTDYGGFHCGVNDGDPCWNRFFSGDAHVVTATFTGVRPYMVEVIDWGRDTPPTEDFIHITGGGYVNVGLLNRGNISILNPDPRPGCQ